MSDLQDLAALIRADTPLIVIETADEPRTVELFRQSLTHVWRALYRWSITEGLRRIDLDREDPADTPPDPGTVFMVWKEFDGENSVVNMRVSHDDGATWSKPHAAAKTDDASDHPMLANDGRRAYLSWMTKNGGYQFLPLKDAP